MDSNNFLAIIAAGWVILGGIFFQVYGLITKKFSLFHTVCFFLLYPIVVNVVTRKLLSIELNGKDCTSNDDWDVRFINKVFNNVWL